MQTVIIHDTAFEMPEYVMIAYIAVACPHGATREHFHTSQFQENCRKFIQETIIDGGTGKIEAWDIWTPAKPKLIKTIVTMEVPIEEKTSKE